MHARKQAAPKPRSSRTTHEALQCSLHGMPNTDTTSCVHTTMRVASIVRRTKPLPISDYII